MRTLIFCAATLAALVALASSNQPVVADGPQAVTITNFPEVQQVSGQIAISQPIPQTCLETRKVVVAPAERSNTNDLTDAGIIDTTGFTHVTLSLTGLLQGSPQGGTVGVLLVPDVPEVTTALRTYGVLQLELGVEAPVSTGKTGLFSSQPATFRLAFPRYRILLYNAAQKSAEATVYAYLSTS